MSYKQFPMDKIYSEIRTAIKNQKVVQPVIDKYYAEVRAKIKPTLQELPPNPDENQIRNVLTQELTPILKNQTNNFIEKLSKANDLLAFYKFSKSFISGVKDVRDLDSSFLWNLWLRFKSKMIIEDKEVSLPKTGLNESLQEFITPFQNPKTFTKKDIIKGKKMEESLINELKNKLEEKSKQRFPKLITSNLDRPYQKYEKTKTRNIGTIKVPTESAEMAKYDFDIPGTIKPAKPYIKTQKASAQASEDIFKQIINTPKRKKQLKSISTHPTFSTTSSTSGTGIVGRTYVGRR